MKPCPLDYMRARSLDHAIELMVSAAEEARIIAGGQSLGPMLNLRLASPKRLIDISHIDELGRAVLDGGELVVGPCVTHARIEDGEIPDATRGLMQHVARGIAYRAVRNRGTIGGSLAHADPAADWVATMLALGARIALRGHGGERMLAIDEFITGPLSTAMSAGEAISAIRIPRLAIGARWGYGKFARKLGDFAESMAVVVVDRSRDCCRVVLARRSEPPARLPQTEVALAREDAKKPIDDAINADLDSLRVVAEDSSLHRAIVRRAVRGMTS
jgi:aerobic carbon-monoxide dehydrogenase medium subunit